MFVLIEWKYFIQLMASLDATYSVFFRASEGIQVNSDVKSKSNKTS